MTLSFTTPDPRLAHYVQCYWLLSGATGGTEVTKYLHPDGGSGLMLAYEGGVSIDAVNLSLGLSAGAARRAPVTLTLRGRIRLIGIRFHPGGSYPFFGTPRFADALDGDAGTPELYDRVGSAPSLRDCGQAVDDWLAQRFDERRRSPLADAALIALRAHHGAARIEHLASDLGCSSRQLERLFGQRIGLPPKQLSRILRVRQAKTLLARRPGRSLTEIAYGLGFADQAHLTREFKSLIGITPAFYRSCRAVDRRPPIAIMPRMEV